VNQQGARGPGQLAIGGVLLLDEQITLRLVLASSAVLGGIALVILERRRLTGA
jgi:drug/metabolite transporter (DMT)-like permease